MYQIYGYVLLFNFSFVHFVHRFSHIGYKFSN